jgi:hypothetical protein
VEADEESDSGAKPFAIDPAFAARYGLIPGNQPAAPNDLAAEYQRIVRELGGQQAKLQELSKKYKTKYPDVVTAQQQISRLTWEKEKLEAAYPNLSLLAQATPAAEPETEDGEGPEAAPPPSQPRYLMDPVLAARYGLLRPGMAVTNVVPASNSARSVRSRPAVRAKLEEITLEEVLYDSLPLNEVVKDLKHEAARRDPKKRGINFLINPSSREGRFQGVDPTTGAPLPQQPIDVGAAIVRINLPLKDVRLIDVLDVIKKVAEPPIRYSIEDYGVVFSSAPAQPLGQMISRTFKIDADTLAQGLANVAGLAVNQASPRGQTQSQQLTDLLRQFLASAGVTIESPNQVFYNDRTGILMIRVSDQEHDIVQAAVEMLSGEKAVSNSPGIFPPSNVSP